MRKIYKTPEVERQYKRIFKETTKNFGKSVALETMRQLKAAEKSWLRMPRVLIMIRIIIQIGLNMSKFQILKHCFLNASEMMSLSLRSVGLVATGKTGLKKCSLILIGK